MRFFLRECSNCSSFEERIFIDSWTGKELCIPCVYDIIGRVSISPLSDGDNLESLLDTMVD